MQRNLALRSFLFLLGITLGLKINSASADEWISPSTPIPSVEFTSREELKDTLIHHPEVSRYFQPSGPLVVSKSYRLEVSPDRKVSSLKYDVGIKVLGITRPFQGDVSFRGCASDLNYCSLRIDLGNSAPSIRDMIPEMRLNFQVVGQNPDGTLRVQPQLSYRKGPKYDELLQHLPSGVIERATQNQIKPLFEALEKYRAQKLGALDEKFNRTLNESLLPRLNHLCNPLDDSEKGTG